ncbi:translation initiation factor IF-3 [Estrella lausannensis]|nr:translation initiation factor IF-3 [Estrella lausannensis]
MRINNEIRTPKVRLIDDKGEQVGVVLIQEAIRMAEEVGLDLVEIVPTSTPPVCKIMNFGKFRYDQTKREKENKKAQHQIKVKEVKFKPNIDDHDLETKLRQAKDFLLKGNKVKITLAFRGREMMHPEVGRALMTKVCDELAEISIAEAPPSMMGRILSTVLSPKAKKK